MKNQCSRCVYCQEWQIGNIKAYYCEAVINKRSITGQKKVEQTDAACKKYKAIKSTKNHE